MKKILSLLLCLVMLASTAALFGCSPTDDAEDGQPDVPPVTDNNDDEGDDADQKTPAPEGAEISIDGMFGRRVVPYVDIAWDYLAASKGKDVADYKERMENPNRDVTLNWDFTLSELPDKYVLHLIADGDYTDERKIELEADVTSYPLDNLYKDTDYDVCVTYVKGETEMVLEMSFKTTDLGPRVMRVDGIYNVRDVGGYMTDSGKMTAQGLLFRGGALRKYNNYNSVLTEEGERVMREILGIKTDLDVRGFCEESNWAEESPIGDAELVYHKLIAYHEIFDVPESVRAIFSLLADPDSYPLYFHCSGGADRTGTLAFLINALLGVSEEDLIHDYEFTTFSIYGERNSKPGTQYGQNFQSFLNILNTYEGNNLKEKTESYLLSIGVTEAEIASIRDILILK